MLIKSLITPTIMLLGNVTVCFGFPPGCSSTPLELNITSAPVGPVMRSRGGPEQQHDLIWYMGKVQST